jgi:hypothetical protein
MSKKGYECGSTKISAVMREIEVSVFNLWGRKRAEGGDP